MTICDATYSDLSEVQQLAVLALPNSWHRLEDWQQELANTLATLRVLRVPHCASIAAFAHVRWFGDEAELLNLATHPDQRQKGFATLLLQDVISQARAKNIRTIHLEVRCSNEPALYLYKAAGFVETGRRPQYYRDNQEDAVLMTRKLHPA